VVGLLLQFTNYSTLYFGADDGVNGVSLWKSDGTEAGTILIGGPGPNQLAGVDGTLFFTADDGVNGGQLWALPIGGINR
jgi:ELWxxDGT repeat protein